jgi:hypothetical protein
LVDVTRRPGVQRRQRSTCEAPRMRSHICPSRRRWSSKMPDGHSRHTLPDPQGRLGALGTWVECRQDRKGKSEPTSTMDPSSVWGNAVKKVCDRPRRLATPHFPRAVPSSRSLAAPRKCKVRHHGCCTARGVEEGNITNTHGIFLFIYPASGRQSYQSTTGRCVA